MWRVTEKSFEMLPVWPGISPSDFISAYSASGLCLSLLSLDTFLNNPTLGFYHLWTPLVQWGKVRRASQVMFMVLGGHSKCYPVVLSRWSNAQPGRTDKAISVVLGVSSNGLQQLQILSVQVCALSTPDHQHTLAPGLGADFTASGWEMVKNYLSSRHEKGSLLSNPRLLQILPSPSVPLED